MPSPWPLIGNTIVLTIACFTAHWSLCVFAALCTGWCAGLYYAQRSLMRTRMFNDIFPPSRPR